MLWVSSIIVKLCQKFDSMGLLSSSCVLPNNVDASVRLQISAFGFFGVNSVEDTTHVAVLEHPSLTGETYSVAHFLFFFWSFFSL